MKLTAKHLTLPVVLTITGQYPQMAHVVIPGQQGRLILTTIQSFYCIDLLQRACGSRKELVLNQDQTH